MEDGAYEIVQSGDQIRLKAYVGSALVHTTVTHATEPGSSESFNFLHRDHLDSVESVSDGAGVLRARTLFAPFGSRRDPDWEDASAEYLASVDEITLETTTQGFTGHEHLDSTGLIHMGGRVYEPEIGRFLSPDPFVQDPEFTQSYNRYSYVFNNPLGLVDPSGFQSQDTTSSGDITVLSPTSDIIDQAPAHRIPSVRIAEPRAVGGEVVDSPEARLPARPDPGGVRRQTEGSTNAADAEVALEEGSKQNDESQSEEQAGERLPTTFESGSPLPGLVTDALEPYFEGFDLTQIRIHNEIPWYVVGQPDAYTSGNNIYFAEGAYNPNTASGLALIAHEVLHSQQYQKLGTFRFRARYLSEYTVGRLRGLSHGEAYRNISLERDAFALQRRVRFDLIKTGYPR